MLGKLIKYEMKAMGRIMLPIYALLLVSSAVVAAYVHMAVGSTTLVGNVLQKFGFVVIMLFVFISMAASIMMAVLVIQRFYKNLLGAEGYLMFTLPATTAQNVISKAVTALIWILIGALAGSIGGIIVIFGGNLADPSEFMSELTSGLGMIFSYIGKGNKVLGGFLLVLTILLSLIQLLIRVYAAFSIGHLWNGHGVLGGVIAYAVFELIESFGRSILHLKSGMFVLLETQDSLSQINVSARASQFGGTVISLLLTMLLIGIYYAITWYILDRRLNLE